MSNVEQVQFTDEEASNLASHDPEPTKTPDGRPEWLDSKFESPEAMAKAYHELERKLGSRKPEMPEPSQTEQPNLNEVVQSVEEQEEQSNTPQQEGEPAPPMLPGLENNVVEEMSNYAWENQSLTDEHYKTLEAAGYSREMVDQYMAGQFAVADDYNAALLEAGGGQQNVETMFGWAQQNLTEAQINAYDEMFDRGGADAMMAMESLRGRYEQAGGSSVWQSVQGANAPAQDMSVFQSNADVIAAMSDPRYNNNPTYRAEVQRKLARSNVL